MLVLVKEYKVEKDDSIFIKARFLLEKLNYCIKKEEQRQYTIYEIPKITKKKTIIQQKKEQKRAKKLLKRLKKENQKQVIFSKELQENESLKNMLYANNIAILTGRRLMKYLSIPILEYVMEKMQTKLQLQKVSVLVNENSSLNLEILGLLAQNVKSMNIISNNVAKFKRLEKQLYEKLGIMITLSNNKKRSLMKSDIILNLDFPPELVWQYQIKKEAILINIEYPVILKAKSFKGMIINHYEITQKEEKEIPEFDTKLLYEAKLGKQSNLIAALQQIKKDGVNIKWVMGRNGVLTEQEFKNHQKVTVNT